jgi:uncharacterized protein (DUF2336 family)
MRTKGRDKQGLSDRAMWAARELLSEMDGKFAQASAAARVAKLSRILDLLAVVPSPMPTDLETIFDTVIQRLAADLEVSDRVQISRRIATMSNAPHGVLRQLAHDKLPVARPVIAVAERLGTQDLVSVAESRGQPHMRVIADRPHLEPTVTDVLVVRGDQDVVSAVVSNTTASFSDNGLQELATRAVTDERLFEKLSNRDDIPVEKLNTLMKAAQVTLAAEMANLKAQQSLSDAVKAGDQTKIEGAATSLSNPVSGMDEAAVERLIALGSVAEEHVAQFVEEKRVHAVCMCLAELARIEYAVADRLLHEEDAEGIIYLCRSLDFSWTTTRSMILMRPVAVPRLDHFESMIDLYHATTPHMARRIFAFRFSGV